MSKIDSSSMFARMEYYGGQTKKEDVEYSKEKDISLIYADVDELLESIEDSGNYSMLPLAVNFMSNLTPFDLFSFFDQFASIESKLFKAEKLNYELVRKSYEEKRDLLKNDYISFIIEYYKLSSKRVFCQEIEYTQEQKEFLDERFTVVRYMLLDIGKRISSEYYSDYVESNSTN